MTNKPEQLPEWRKLLNEAVENYQSTRAWYEENQDSPSAEQDMDAAAGEIAKLIKQYGVLIVLNLLDEIDELQERRKTTMDSEPVAWDYEWASCITCEGPQDFKRVIEREAPPEWAIEEGQARNVIPLYRHAQPAPVVPDECKEAPAYVKALTKEGAYIYGFNACRAAMLQAGNSPVTPDGSEDTKRLNWLDTQNKRLNEYYGTAYGWKFDANFQRNAMMLNDSNYPVMTIRQAIDEAISVASQQEVKSALEIGISRYAGAMQELADSGD